MLILGSGEVI